jgi:glyoxylate/hydroxypyruvate reductase A
MKIIYYNGSHRDDDGSLLQQRLPEANVRLWRAGDQDPADFAVVWKPPAEMLAGRADLKAVFCLGAGVDALLKQGNRIPFQLPIYRLEDAGMGDQMADYVSHAVLRYFRRFDQYQNLAEKAEWLPHRPRAKREFKVAVLGLGVLGSVVAARLKALNFPVLGWSRNPKSVPGVECHAGPEGLKRCLEQASAVVSILPLTADTAGLLNRGTLMHMPPGGYLINVGRGAHVDEADLVMLLNSGHLAGATLDVFQTEPLPDGHPFWNLANLTITPHISALTIMEEAHDQVATKLRSFEQGRPVTGLVDRNAGY